MARPIIFPNQYHNGELIIHYRGNPISVGYDFDDEELLKQYHWVPRKKKNKVYVVTKYQRYIHQVIVGEDVSEGYEIDHIDGNSLNNHRDNLRVVSRIDNIHNYSTQINSSTGLRGVSPCFRNGRDQFTVEIEHNTKRYRFKRFDTLAEASYLRFLCEKKFIKGLTDKTTIPHLEKAFQSLSEEGRKEIESYFLQKTS